MPDFSFHIWDVAVRLTEEAFFHPTPLYQVLDKTFGISKIDPFIQLGIYDQAKQMLGAVTQPTVYATQATVPAFVPPLPGAGKTTVMMSGGQLPSRQRKAEGEAKFFG
jgi:hypothetical protein